MSVCGRRYGQQEKEAKFQWGRNGGITTGGAKTQQGKIFSSL